MPLDSWAINEAKNQKDKVITENGAVKKVGRHVSKWVLVVLLTVFAVLMFVGMNLVGWVALGYVFWLDSQDDNGAASEAVVFTADAQGVLRRPNVRIHDSAGSAVWLWFLDQTAVVELTVDNDGSEGVSVTGAVLQTDSGAVQLLHDKIRLEDHDAETIIRSISAGTIDSVLDIWSFCSLVLSNDAAQEDLHGGVPNCTAQEQLMVSAPLSVSAAGRRERPLDVEFERDWSPTVEQTCPDIKLNVPPIAGDECVQEGVEKLRAMLAAEES